MNRSKHRTAHCIILVTLLLIPLSSFPQDLIQNPELDKKVEAFLKESRYRWRDMNVPAVDGQLLYDIIMQNGYTRALEIGTSTGHSGIWIAWALSKTGGKLITIEINERRYRKALENFEEAGLSDYIDARLADAHELVKELEGPFDFVFSDADKAWYKNYFIDVDPKLAVGGCFTGHNVTGRRSRYSRGQDEFLEYVRSLDNYNTTVNTSGGGVSISYKKSK
ncbi:MAG: class I SAM-dependent methyltransferase [Bacteroidota bacterium]|nr:class I SAM-dependent methyltransferase [Bacteroidota bacterium]